jgi:ankyrin repeat protein
LLNDAHGMYLWVAFQINTICFEQTDQDILNALEDLPRDLPETFNRILGKLRGPRGMSSSPTSTVNVFRIVAAARRPLMLEELREAISVEPGVTAWDPRKVVNDIEKLLANCGSLLVVDEEDHTVRFTHQSVLQFLSSELVSEKLRDFKIDLASADLEMGNICVTYLNSERHNSQLVKPVEQKPHLVASSSTLSRTIPSSTFAGKIALKLLRKRPDLKHTLIGLSNSYSESLDHLHHAFLGYAQQNWLDHTKRLSYAKYPKLWRLWKLLITGKVNVVQLPWAPEDCFDFDTEFIKWLLQHQQLNVVYMILAHADYKIPRLLRLRDIVERVCCSTSEEKTLKKILHAFQLLHLRIVSPLDALPTSNPNLHMVSPLNALSTSNLNLRMVTVLSAVLTSNSIGDPVECMRVLLEQGADPDFYNFGHGTALYAACDHENANRTIVRLLLESGADANVQGGRYGTPLQAACVKCSKEVVKLLLQNGADVNIQGGEYGTALQAASAYGQEDLVRLLLRNGADVDVQGGKHGTALQAAACTPSHGWEEVINLLLNYKADVNIQGGEYGTALQAACAKGREEYVKLLLQERVNINFQGGKYGTALQAACANGHQGCVKLLLQNGADANIQGGMYGTALQAAKISVRSTKGHYHFEDHKEVVSLLQEHGAIK